MRLFSYLCLIDSDRLEVEYKIVYLLRATLIGREGEVVPR